MHTIYHSFSSGIGAATMKLFSRRQRQSRPENWIMLYYVSMGEQDPSSNGRLTAVGRAQTELVAGIIRVHAGKDKLVVFSSDKKDGTHAETTEILASSLGVDIEEACFRQEFDDSAITPKLVEYLSKGKNCFVIVENSSFIGSLLSKYLGHTAEADSTTPPSGSVRAMRIQLTRPQLDGEVIDKHFVVE